MIKRVNLVLVLLVVIAILRVKEVCKFNRVEPLFLSCFNTSDQPNISNRLQEKSGLALLRAYCVKTIKRDFPSPHSELLLGMLLGVDDLKNVPRFNDVLRTSGTIHVVVASGFNMSLVIIFSRRIVGSLYNRKGFILMLIMTFSYAVITGFEPPIVRSWIMGVVALYVSYLGRSASVKSIIYTVALIIIILSPTYINNLSFQLSFLATLGLVIYSDYIDRLVRSLIDVPIFTSDLSTTLAAQVLVLPLISVVFGQISLVSPIINALVLWSTAPITLFGFFYLILRFIPLVGFLYKIALFILLDYFVVFVEFFSKIPFASISLSPNNKFLLIYYLVLIFVTKKYVKNYK